MFSLFPLIVCCLGFGGGIIILADASSTWNNPVASETPSVSDNGATSPSYSMGSPESLKLSPRIISLNIMVAGLAGLGKSTFCKALLDSWWQEVEGERANGEGNTKKEADTGRRRFLSYTVPTRKISKPVTLLNTATTSTATITTPIASTATISPSVPFEYYDEEANTLLRVTIIDTPGFGNQVNHKNSIKPITDYISRCRHRRFRREQSPSSASSHNHHRSIDSDSDYNSMLIHVCLYFISPGRFLAIDRHFLKNVQDEVTIVPIIAKADTLTDDEIVQFREKLSEIWDKESINIYSLDYDDNDDDNGDDQGGDKKSIIRNGVKMMMSEIRNSNKSSNKKKMMMFHRGRRPGEVLAIIARDGTYPWGTNCALDPQHSDLNLIRDLLLSDHTEQFLKLAKGKYCSFRDKQITRKRRFDVIKYAVMFGLLTIQLKKVELMRDAISKIISFFPINRVLDLLPSKVGINNRASTLVEDTVDESKSLEEITDEEVKPIHDRRRIFGLFKIP